MDFSEFSSVMKVENSIQDNNICRVCLEKGLLINFLEKPSYSDGTIASLIFFVCGVDVLLQTENHPNFICSDCLTALEIGARVKKKCLESDRLLKEKLPITSNPNFVEVKKEKVEFDYEDDNDTFLGPESFDDNFQTEDNEIMDFPSISVETIPIKKEKKAPATKTKAKTKEKDPDYIPPAEPKVRVLPVKRCRKPGKSKPIPKRRNEKVMEGTVCRNCSKAFSDKYALKRHSRRCKRRFYYCAICQEIIQYKSDYEKHVKQHEENGEPPLSECPKCNQKLFSREAIHEHPCPKDEEVIKYNCRMCNSEFPEFKDILNHMRVYRKDSTYTCPNADCLKNCGSPRYFYHHLESHFNPANCICAYCGLLFVDKMELMMHKTTHKTNEIDYKFSCDKCGSKFSRKDIVIRHMQKKHLAEVPKKEEKPDLLCDQCSLGFKTPVLLQKHQIRQHGAIGDFQCEICGEWFLQSHALDKHMKIHDKPKVSCPICSLEQKNEAELKIHVELVHQRDTKHKCPTCFKSFKYAWHLDTHLKIHTGEKDFQCIVCNKRFISKPALSEHMRSHTGETPYACTIKNCDKKYRSHKGLRSHYTDFHKLKKPLPKLVKTKSSGPLPILYY